ncbi:hypothetical protein Tco_1030878 [Tanacetum coccineum]|uniref:Uncharacterized protein n=1 Tax=Tanacetum coccineum TaxID=301880 RepID=A0ABQ5G9A3_9ASTR
MIQRAPSTTTVVKVGEEKEEVSVIVPRINASDIIAELGEDKEKEILGNIPLANWPHAIAAEVSPPLMPYYVCSLAG